MFFKPQAINPTHFPVMITCLKRVAADKREKKACKRTAKMFTTPRDHFSAVNSLIILSCVFTLDSSMFRNQQKIPLYRNTIKNRLQNDALFAKNYFQPRQFRLTRYESLVNSKRPHTHSRRAWNIDDWWCEVNFRFFSKTFMHTYAPKV